MTAAATPQQLIRPDVLAMHAYPVADATGLIKLDLMENPYSLPPALQQALAERLARVAMNRYPIPQPLALKAKLAAAMGVPNGAELMLGNGSDELITLITLALARPGAVVLGPEPSFSMYRMNAQFNQLRYVGLPLNADYTLNTAELLAAIAAEKPALVWLAYPNNPTGNLYPRADIEAVIAATPGLVVIDEAYSAFADGATFMGDVLRHPNLVVLRTLSKLGLAGLRLGYCAAKPEWIHEFDKVRPPFNVGVLVQAAAEFALDHLEVFEAQVDSILRERDRLEAALDLLAIGRFPTAANFITVRVSNAPAALSFLKSRGILVRSFHGAHPLMMNTLRLTVGTPDENAALIQALGELVAQPVV